MDNFLETLKNLGPGRLMMMAATFFGLIVFFIFIAARSSNPTMTLLYGELSVTDATEAAAKLDASGIPYTLEENGTQISVPGRDVGKARMLLAQEGLPRNANMGYEIFDQKQRFGQTSFEQNINKLRALEGELARTIGTIGPVRNARVHLVLPQRELFSRDTQPASASVFINVRNNAAVGREQIQAIQHLIAAAVPQLKATRVAIIDQNGDLLASGEEEDTVRTNARDGEDMRNKYERRLARSIEDMVGRIVGFGKVCANVTADLDFDVISRNSETYDPEGQVVRSTQTITDESIDNTGAQGGTVSVENNLPGLAGANGGNGATVGASSNRTEEVTNFEISKTIENVVRSSGDVNKLSIAVLLDGAYIPDPNATRPEDAGDDWEAPQIYVERSQEELDKITSLVKSAVGYDEDRGDIIEVINMPFAEVDTYLPLPTGDTIMGFPKQDILGMAETLALSIVAVLIILLVLRPLATHFSAPSGAGVGEEDEFGNIDPTLLATGIPGDQPQLAAPGAAGGPESELEQMIDMSSVEGKVKASSVQKISELITNHPNETVSVIRQWMGQEN